MATKTLYVGNLPYSTDERGLAELFSAYGATNPRIIEGRGFGFVDVDSDRMQSAIDDKNSASVGGRTLTVNEARPREERSGGGGGGNSRGGGGGYGNRGGRW